MSDIIDKLERLSVLLQSGVLTQTEFETQKAKLLDGEAKMGTNGIRGGRLRPSKRKSHSGAIKKAR